MKQLFFRLFKFVVVLTEWIALKASRLDSIDGVIICDTIPSQSDKDAFLAATRQAMSLIKSIDPRRYRRVCRHLRYIENTMLLSKGQYEPGLKACRVDYEKAFMQKPPPANIRDFAATIIHEATHGLLFDKDIPYNKENWQRVEKLCHREAHRFLLHFGKEYADSAQGPFNPQNWKKSPPSEQLAWRKRAWTSIRSSLSDTGRKK